ncbi:MULTISPECIES: Na+/H+ antiporter family protein [Larsenimonas]|uniref:Na+/H+ antiporter family protein n=1 Tax=Larsenimonas suaedae TaxID=1851019 RepID=A0ABU1GU94_9GAMM|nr:MULTISPECIES: Na+/H+ antiporter family protein [Larsenimonas]MCM2972026.1 Na+/H+ antiporter family protein [Larsenimonas suaedae]MCM5705411.1 Na+/H+ antiporter family protein [Larsenimonas salina]MDR5895578.1 Na+/H+ antiporter family protein [Larsenimonas suaedae]
MNAIVLSILVMVTLSLARVSVVFALVVAALVGGLYSGMPLGDILDAFNGGLGSGAQVALSYATLGAFAVALSRSGLTEAIARKLIGRLSHESDHGVAASRAGKTVKWSIIGVLLVSAVCSQNLIPVHIAFIPIMVPPLLMAMNRLNLDRRLVACVITFGVTAPYMLLPVGFGAIFLNDILLSNINEAGAAFGLQVTADMVPMAMAMPIGGMAVGLLIAVFISYRGPRTYSMRAVGVGHVASADDVVSEREKRELDPLKPWQYLVLGGSILAALTTQLLTDSMVLGGLLGFAILSVSGVFRWREQDDVVTEGMRLMTLIGFIMITAAGFASVMQATGQIDTLVESSRAVIGDSQVLAALVMLVVGLFITMGIGSSFSTIPIIASIYVPLALEFGFSPMATIALVGTAAALGDAGSPASDSTLGPTSGLNADGQHDHIWDSVVPTFLHYNIPLLLFGWAAALLL